MKRLTTIILAVAFMIAGVSAAFMDYNPPSNKTMMAATIPEPLQWNTNGLMPLDLQLDLDKRLSHETPTVEPERIVDTIYVDKIKWKTRYKTVAARTTAREVGEHIPAVTPDSMPHVPTIISTLEREEQPNDFEESPNGPSIQLTVDGVIVYQSEDVIHSTEESQ
jgi:hypothetical protein